MTWTVHLHAGAAKQLNAIPPDRRKRILDDIVAFEQDPFRGLVKPLKGKQHKGRYRKVSGRYRIIFKPIHATHTVKCSQFFSETKRRTNKAPWISRVTATALWRRRSFSIVIGQSQLPWLVPTTAGAAYNRRLA